MSYSQDLTTKKKLLMIPGPTEFDPTVLSTLSEPTESHLSPSFIKIFGSCLNNLRIIFNTDSSSQPFVLSGGGTLGWDIIASNLCEPELNDNVLLLNTGYFSENLSTCLKHYNVNVDVLNPSSIGDTIHPLLLQQQLKKKNYKLLCITHVDTSTGVRTDIKTLCNICHNISPSTFIIIDGVCSVGGEELNFSEWNIDGVITASQKALGIPPGLSIIVLSSRCINYIINERKNPIHSYYSNLYYWYPIMKSYEQGKPSYFSTPNVNLIKSLYKSTNLLIKEGIDNIVTRHKIISLSFKSAIKSLNLNFVPINDNIMANTLTCIKYPSNITGEEFLKYVNEYGVIFAGGLYSDIKSQYFRVGHIGISTKYNSDHIIKSIEAIEYALSKLNYKFNQGVAIQTYIQELNNYKKLYNIPSNYHDDYSKL